MYLNLNYTVSIALLDSGIQNLCFRTTLYMILLYTTYSTNQRNTKTLLSMNFHVEMRSIKLLSPECKTPINWQMYKQQQNTL